MLKNNRQLKDMKAIKKILGLMFGLMIMFSFHATAQYKKEGNQNNHFYQNKSVYEVNEIYTPKGKKVKNVILMIGDGMSLMHAYSAWTANKGQLNLENCDFVGLSKTYCADNLITDSAASGTAIATGQKTKKGYVGVDAEGESLKSICEYAGEGGLSTGIVASCRLIDATPASFSVENINRDMEEEIAASYPTSGVDFILGGGLKYFTKRKDGKNLLPEFEQNGYQVVTDMEQLTLISEGKVFAPIAENDMAKPNIRKDQLWQGTKKALEILNKDKDGFFLMVEGSQIDDYGHFNDLPTLMEEVMDFDRTVGQVFQWASDNHGTLVVITSDHETGGLTLVGGSLEEGKIEGHFSTTHHSGVMVPVYSFGPGAASFSGIYENTDIFNKIKSALKL